MDEAGFLPRLAQTIAQKQEPVVVVHGGGRAIADLQQRLGLQPVKVDGLRVTDAASLRVAEMALSGQANKEIVRAFLAAGLDAVGLSGTDGALLRCRPKTHPAVDLGFVGEVTEVRAELLQRLLAAGITVVLSPISLGPSGQAYNVNADEAASAVALALRADGLDFVSNVEGVLHQGQPLARLSAEEAESLISAGVIRDGMVPKVRAALDAIGRGVPEVRIVNLSGLLQGGGTRFSAAAAPCSGGAS